ncbi:MULTISPECIES: alpha/beta hydrolase [unclassified Endozoicomonas]|uniref:alpha/beta hydrolase n=1 Tax=unclassified Endozoicomonas TaxID=2644528 RepID=UPI003BB5A728
MNMMTLLRIKNRFLGTLLPGKVARDHVTLFLSPRRFPLKDWEEKAELNGQRISFGAEFDNSLSALRWGEGGEDKKRVLIMHGWESRATQMQALAQPLIEEGYEVIAIDAPRHGLSKGKQANPVQFALAVIAACHELGPFDAAIGHSMGCAGLAIAREQGAAINRYVLMASPANMLDTLRAFADFMGLPKTCTEKFIVGVGHAVGRPAEELDIGTMLADGQPDVLLVHARNDIEVPFAAMTCIHDKLGNAQTWTSPSLGHRKLVRDPDIASMIGRFISTGHVVEEKLPGHA